MSLDPRPHLPLKDLTFRILVALGNGELHGWAIAQALSDTNAPTRVLPGHLYRTLDNMLDAGLITERSEASLTPRARVGGGAAPSRFFSLTALGRVVARAETDRLEALVTAARAGRLLKGKPR